MDNLTHTLFGMVLARAGLARRCGPGTTLALAIASNLPDVDGLYALVAGGDAWLHRRIATHALPMLPLVSLLGACALRPFLRQLAPLHLFLLMLLGTLGHTLLDLLNSFGVVLLWPLSRARYELGWVFVVDLVFLALLVLPLLAGRRERTPTSRGRQARVSLGLVAVFLGLCALARLRAQQLVAATAAPGPGRRMDAFPEPLGAHRFRVVVEREGAWDEFLCNTLTGSCERLRTVPDQAQDPRVRAARATAAGLELEWFFAAPVWQVLPGGAEVEVFDLRFTAALLSRERPFARRLPLPP